MVEQNNAFVNILSSLKLQLKTSVVSLDISSKLIKEEEEEKLRQLGDGLTTIIKDITSQSSEVKKIFSTALGFSAKLT